MKIMGCLTCTQNIASDDEFTRHAIAGHILTGKPIEGADAENGQSWADLTALIQSAAASDKEQGRG